MASSYSVHRSETSFSFRKTAFRIVSVIVLAIVIASLAWLIISQRASLPVKYVYPDGSCAIIVEFIKERRVGHDCGWEVGRKYESVYISDQADLRILHDRQ